MSPKEVKRRLAELGITQTDLSKMWKLSTATVNKKIHRKFNSKRLDKRLARVLGVTPEYLRGEEQGAPQ